MRLSPVAVDVAAVVGVIVLAAMGRMSPELASGTILAVLAGRMKPVGGEGRGPRSKREDTPVPSSAEPPSDPSAMHLASLSDLRLAYSAEAMEPSVDPRFEPSHEERPPSGVLTLLHAPAAAFAAFHK